MEERWVASIVPLCVYLSEVTHTEKSVTRLSLKNWKREREVGGLHCSTVCLPEVTHRRKHNRFKSKKLKERWVASIVPLSA